MCVNSSNQEICLLPLNVLTAQVALITGADSGIGRAVALAFAREGADVAIAYLNEHEDAKVGVLHHVSCHVADVVHGAVVQQLVWVQQPRSACMHFQSCSWSIMLHKEPQRLFHEGECHSCCVHACM